MNLEALVTHPDGFGLTGATPVQRAICRVMTGASLGELANHTDVIQMLGGREAVAKLGPAPRMVVLGAAVRCAKSTIVAAKAVRNAYLGDCSGLAPGEVPRVNIVSVDLDKAKETFSKITGAMLTSPRLNSLLLAPPKADSLLMRNRSGWPVEIKMIAGSRAGQTLVSRWCLGAIFDEAPRMIGQSDGVINLEDALSAIRARMRPGAQIDLVGSLWAPRGPVYELVTKRHGLPGADVIVMLATGPMLRPDLYTPEYCEQIRLDDDRAYESDVMSRFADPETALVPSIEVAAAVRPDIGMNPVHGWEYVAVMDPATRGNGWTLAIIGSNGHGRFELAVAREWIGSRALPLKASVVLPEIDAELQRFGVTDLHTDQWGFDILSDVAELVHTSFSLVLATRDDNVAGPKLYKMLTEHTLGIPDVKRLRQDLIALKRKPKQGGGSQIVFPLTADGRHCDYGAAVLLGVQVLPDAHKPKEEPLLDEEELFCLAAQARDNNRMNGAAMRLMGHR